MVVNTTFLLCFLMDVFDLLHCIFADAVAVLAQQGGAPDYVTLQFSYHVREDTRNGTILFNFTARYTDRHRNVTVTSASPTYVTVEKANGSEDLWSVRLNNILDREVRTHALKLNAE